MKIYRIAMPNDPKAFLKQLGVESGGVSIIADKMEHYCFYLKDVRTPALNILKQDALSIGAELAVPSGVITCEKEHYDALLIGTRKHIGILSRKELAQPFGLKTLAGELKAFLKERPYPVQIMGVININEDSFFQGSRFAPDAAVERIRGMIGEGAQIIDIGAVSSRPGSVAVPAEEELARLRPLFDAIRDERLWEEAVFSIDSYEPLVLEYALECGFGLVNDITGGSDPRVIGLAARYGAKLCIMHMQGTPQTMQQSPHYDDVTAEVSEFFEERIARCEAAGMQRADIILDVGIGFGKKLEHNIALIRNLSHFKKFGCPLLVGASRKSMIDQIIPTPVEERLEGTLAIHLKALENGAHIIRCHDVKEHSKAMKVWEALKL